MIDIFQSPISLLNVNSHLIATQKDIKNFPIHLIRMHLLQMIDEDTSPKGDINRNEHKTSEWKCVMNEFQWKE